ncbi:Kelch-like protein 10 [Cichlidogyrus casuarinus]|uniref:Kelch-like protein 10 n=1 Tax=Cichlidogyrus casuarinus TaxID=1844966 RepID=A0ABD2QL01_9PLAT
MTKYCMLNCVSNSQYYDFEAAEWKEVDNREAIADSEKYDLDTNEWTDIAPMNRTAYYHSAVVFDGKIYLAGGCNKDGMGTNMEAYDPQTNQWTLLANPEEGHYMGLMYCDKDTLMIAGGVDSQERYVRTAEKYDPVKDEWTVLPESLCFIMIKTWWVPVTY